MVTLNSCARISGWLVLLGLFFGCAQKQAPLRIAAAANLQYVAAELCQQYEQATGQATDLVIGSSGQLYHQILAGAPYDVFLSADLQYPQHLHAADHAAAARIYANGQLVLWSTEASVDSLSDLLRPDFTQVAIANPDLAPYGKAAQVALQEAGLWEALQTKLVYGESIAQVNQFVSTAVVDAGITSVSLPPHLRPPEAHWLPLEAHTALLPQGACLLQRSPQPEQADRFLGLLFSEQGKATLSSYGYVVD